MTEQPTYQQYQITDKRTLREYKQWDLWQRNFKPWYYLKAFSRMIVPGFVTRLLLPFELKRLERYQSDELKQRVDYYNKLTDCRQVTMQLDPLESFKLPEKQRVYFFDSQQYLRYFSKNLRAKLVPGDVRHVPELPAFVKSRPIGDDIRNSVLLKLGKARHFQFVNDPVPFAEKRNMLIGRSAAHQKKRKQFLEMYMNHPLCNVGQVNKSKNSWKWQVPKITIREHLNYKFILCLEGHDVATNLKWVMSSNSLAVMPRPKFETWFMEGQLIPDVHYVEIKPDFSDVEERLRYYIEHEDEALQIVRNANAWVERFKNRKSEKLVALLVVKKYFEQTGQI